MAVDKLWGSREAHLDILHAQDVPAVVHVLLEVFVLDERKELKGWTKLEARQQPCSCIIMLDSAEGHE